MPRLSLVMIIKNEESCLADALGSILHIIDEMIIVDTGSVDGTVDIARRFGAKVTHFQWVNDFSAARNKCISEASGDWLFCMDADEMLDPESAHRIRAIVDADGAPVDIGGRVIPGPKADVIMVRQANYSDEATAWIWEPVTPGDPWARGRAGCLPVQHPRLFRNHMGLEYRRPVHEDLMECVREKNAVVRKEPATVHHYGLAPANAPIRPKDLMYLEIEREHVRRNPHDPKGWFDLGFQLLSVDEAEAEKALAVSLSLDPSNTDTAGLLTGLLAKRGAFNEALRVIRPLVNTPNPTVPLMTAMGAICIRTGDMPLALSSLRAVIEQYPGSLQARLYLARALDVTSQAALAAIQLQFAVELAPSLDGVQRRLEAHRIRTDAEEMHIKGQVPKVVLSRLVEALKKDPDDPVAYSDVGVVFAAIGVMDEARTSLERALTLAPGFVDARENLKALG